MHASTVNNSCIKKNDIRVVLDEPRLFVEASLGSIMVRGEVVVHFTKDTAIQGPIELVFEGIQRFQTWPEIMRFRPLGDPIESKLQVIELSLLPPNSQGVMPAGIQRFPFEFPIPASLPASIFIQDRIEIFYHVTATLRRSCLESNALAHWMEKAYRVSQKKKYVHQTPLRIVRPVQSFISQQEHDDSISSSSEPTTPILPWNRTSLHGFDEQHDQLSCSLAGRTTSNNTLGVRYKLSVDRTAIVMGTSVGIEVMVEPTENETKIKSILLNVTERRAYAMKIPADHSWNTYPPETRNFHESVKMVLKWAYPTTNNNNKNPSFDSNPQTKFALPQQEISKMIKTTVFEKEKNVCEMVNLKEIDQMVRLGECFDGRFMMSVPDCDHLLHPSTEYDSIKVSHWLQLSMTLESKGVISVVHLESPMHMLDCRLVAADDDSQTILPPPPSYQSEHYRQTRPASTFWEQREPITNASGWGNCLPCPCELRKMQKQGKKMTKRNQPEWGPPPCYSE
ncbi:unnamed protein product [Rhizopus stolonifer]